MTSGTHVRVGRRSVEITHTSKPYFPDDGITKGDVLDYYRRIGEVMVPHLEGRPLTMHRFPGGLASDGFFQQARPDHFPDWVGAATLPRREGGELVHTVVDSTAGLLVVANYGCLTPHVWLSRCDRPEHPDTMVFDLDPSGDDFAAVLDGARLLRELLEEVGLFPLVKTTGSRGLHVTVPLAREHDFDEVRAFASEVAEVAVGRAPDVLTTEQRKDRRGEKVYVDVQRNAYGQHAVAPYALRARPGAPVATPVDWDELSGRDVSPRRWTISNLFRRLGQRDDPWRGAWRHARSLDGPREALGGL